MRYMRGRQSARPRGAESVADTSASGYVISVAASRVNVHAQTLRHYERLGLIAPSRTPGNIRLYSDRDLERVSQVQRLVGELGVNLAGVEVILNLTDKLEKQRQEMEQETASVRQHYEGEIARLKRIIEHLQAGRGRAPEDEDSRAGARA